MSVGTLVAVAAALQSGYNCEQKRQPALKLQKHAGIIAQHNKSIPI